MVRDNPPTSWAVATLGIWAFMATIVVDRIVYDIHQWNARAQGSPVATELAASHARLMEIAVAISVVTVGPVVTYLAWQARAHARARDLGAEGRRFGPVAAVAGWIVPVVNLVAPCWAMVELWRSSAPDEKPRGWRRGLPNPLIFLWWAMWLNTVALTAWGIWRNHHLGGIILVAGSPDRDPARFLARDWTFVAAAMSGFLAALLAITLIVWVNHRQFEKEGRRYSHGLWAAAGARSAR